MWGIQSHRARSLQSQSLAVLVQMVLEFNLNPCFSILLLCSSPRYYSAQGQDRQFEIGGFALKGTILVKKPRVIQGSLRWRSGEMEGAVGSESDAGFAQSPSDVKARNQRNHRKNTLI